MHKKINGFTMAEMLITMGIIGVVAALTLPLLVNKFAYASFGPTLGSAVQRLELGFRNIIESANKNIVEQGESPLETLSAINVEDLFYSETKPNTTTDLLSDSGKNLFTKAGGILGVEEATGIGNYSFKNLNGQFITDTVFKIESSPYKIKKLNAILYYSSIQQKNEPDALIGKILIDVNGKDKPNRAGYDVFLFGLRNDGKLIPAGSKEYNKSYNTVPVTAGNCSGTVNGLSCTAIVAQENWNINYIK